MLELWGIGTVVKEPVIKQSSNGGQNVSCEVNFQERKRDSTPKDQVIKVRAWGSSGTALGNAKIGDQLLIAGKLEVNTYEYEGRPAKSYCISATGVAEMPRGARQQAGAFAPRVTQAPAPALPTHDWTTEDVF